MVSAGLGSNISNEILRDDIGDILDPFSSVLSRNGFIGHRIAPFYSVGRPAGQFPKRLLGSILKRINTKRKEDGTSRRIYVSIGGADYSVRPYVIEFPIDEWQEATYRDRFNMVMEGIDQMRDALARDFEINVAQLVQGAATYDDDWRKIEAAKPWNDPTADIIGDIERAKRIRDKKMIPANALIVSDRIFRQFSLNHAIQGRITSEGAGFVNLPSQFTKARLCDLFGVEEILVGSGKYDETNETSAVLNTEVEDMNLTPIWNDNTVQLGCVLPFGQAPRFSRPSFAYTMQWRRGPGGRGERVDMYREPQRQGWVYRIRTNYEIKVVGDKTYSQIQETWDESLDVA